MNENKKNLQVEVPSQEIEAPLVRVENVTTEIFSKEELENLSSALESLQLIEEFKSQIAHEQNMNIANFETNYYIGACNKLQTQINKLLEPIILEMKENQMFSNPNFNPNLKKKVEQLIEQQPLILLKRLGINANTAKLFVNSKTYFLKEQEETKAKELQKKQAPLVRVENVTTEIFSKEELENLSSALESLQLIEEFKSQIAHEQNMNIANFETNYYIGACNKLQTQINKLLEPIILEMKENQMFSNPNFNPNLKKKVEQLIEQQPLILLKRLGINANTAKLFVNSEIYFLKEQEETEAKELQKKQAPLVRVKNVTRETFSKEELENLSLALESLQAKEELESKIAYEQNMDTKKLHIKTCKELKTKINKLLEPIVLKIKVNKTFINPNLNLNLKKEIEQLIEQEPLILLNKLDINANTAKLFVNSKTYFLKKQKETKAKELQKKQAPLVRVENVMRETFSKEELKNLSLALESLQAKEELESKIAYGQNMDTRKLIKTCKELKTKINKLLEPIVLKMKENQTFINPNLNLNLKKEIEQLIEQQPLILLKRLGINANTAKLFVNSKTYFLKEQKETKAKELQKKQVQQEREEKERAKAQKEEEAVFDSSVESFISSVNLQINEYENKRKEQKEEYMNSNDGNQQHIVREQYKMLKEQEATNFKNLMNFKNLADKITMKLAQIEADYCTNVSNVLASSINKISELQNGLFKYRCLKFLRGVSEKNYQQIIQINIPQSDINKENLDNLKATLQTLKLKYIDHYALQHQIRDQLQPPSRFIKTSLNITTRPENNIDTPPRSNQNILPIELNYTEKATIKQQKQNIAENSQMSAQVVSNDH